MTQQEFFEHVVRALEATAIPYMVTGSKAATPEDIVLSKLAYYQLGESGKHLDDIIGVLRIAGTNLDIDYIDHWVERLGLVAEWQTARTRADTGQR